MLLKLVVITTSPCANETKDEGKDANQEDRRKESTEKAEAVNKRREAEILHETEPQNELLGTCGISIEEFERCFGGS